MVGTDVCCQVCFPSAPTPDGMCRADGSMLDGCVCCTEHVRREAAIHMDASCARQLIAIYAIHGDMILSVSKRGPPGGLHPAVLVVMVVHAVSCYHGQ